MNKTIGILLLIAVSSYFIINSFSSEETSLSYQTETISIGEIESLVATVGTMKAVVTVEVGSEVSGLITELLADFNSDVKQGQIIAKLDARTITARLKQVDADIDISNASLAQQQASYRKAEEEFQQSERNLKRQKTLFKQKLINDAEVEQAQADTKVKAALLDISSAQILTAKAQIKQRLAQREQTVLDLERTSIRSPVDGVIIDRKIDIGQTVAASLSAPTLFTIAQDLRDMQIEADIDEADIGKILVDQVVRFSVDAYPERKFSGVVSQIRKAASVVQSVVTYKVIIDASNPQKKLLPGMTANIEIILAKKKAVRRIPNAALRFKPKSIKPDSSDADLSPRFSQLIQTLDLTNEQKQPVQEILLAFINKLKELRENSSQQTDRRAQMQQMQKTLNKQLKEILNDKQMATYQQQRSSGRKRGARTTTRRGQVWVLDEDDQPQSKWINLGLNNNEFTELLSDNLNNDSRIITRANRQKQ